MKIKKPIFWDYKKISFKSILLLPISIIYQLLFWFNKILVLNRSNNKLAIPIICVGNIYIGGTGKTPLVREIFKITKSFGKKPAFIKKYHNYLSDEIEMLKETGRVFINSKRKDGINLSALNGHDVAILDDGFQDFSIRPNFSILCFNSKQMIGNGLVIPSGPLRESLNAIQRADCIIINGDQNFEFEKKISGFKKNKKLDIFYSEYKIKDIEKFKNKKITAFAGIGNPSNFFDLLRKNNLNIVKTYSFPDHYNYSKKDFEILTDEKSDILITTEKDYYRINDEQKKECDFIEVNLEIKNEKKFREILKSYL